MLIVCDIHSLCVKGVCQCLGALCPSQTKHYQLQFHVRVRVQKRRSVVCMLPDSNTDVFKLCTVDYY